MPRVALPPRRRLAARTPKPAKHPKEVTGECSFREALALIKAGNQSPDSAPVEAIHQSNDSARIGQELAGLGRAPRSRQRTPRRSVLPSSLLPPLP